MTISLFTGYDEREAIGWHVFVASVLEHATVPVAIHALDARGLPVGSNAFTYSRFAVPWLMGFQGHAIYVDACDMLMMGDIAELDALFNPTFAVQVVRHKNYQTKHPIKYVGTSMQCPNLSYPKKNWGSVMQLNCAHPYWRALTPDTIAERAARPLLQFDGLDDAAIGALPDCWNRLLDESQPVEGAKICHWTGGSPAFPHYHDTPGADLWRAQRDRMMEIDRC